MNRSMILKLAASGLVLGFAASSYSAVGANKAERGDRVVPAKPDQAAKAAAKARALLADGKAARALGQAELAVSLDNGDAGHRALLGQAYLSSGRFASAATAFEDSVKLGLVDPQTIIGLTLSRIATGDSRGALKLIDEHRAALPASDAGLAQVLAGDVQRAIFTLTEAAREPDASARTRQNLAFAFAMAGRWAQARIVAAQDLSPAKLDGRMTEWASMAQQSQPAWRVATMLGVKPAEDKGMPVRLALVEPQAPVALAEAAVAADPAPLAQYAPPPPAAVVVAAATDAATPSAPVAVAAAAPQPAIRSIELPMPTSPEKVAEAQIILAETRPYRVAPRAAGANAPTRIAAAAAVPGERPAATEARALAAQVNAPALRARSFDAKKPSGWAVQLGAYDTLGIAKEKWATLSRANGLLKAFPASSQSAAVKGRTFYRLTVNGLATRGEAMALCASLKAAGQGCFVRSMNANENVQWAARPTMKLASR